jgi:amino acid transporter
MSITDWIFGKPITTEEDEDERVGVFAGIGVLGLDALASASYGPEALLTVLLPLGPVALTHLPGLIGAILVLLMIVAASYRQTITAYPSGGGAYTVAKVNLGVGASLLAASALALDYVLNAAVAVSAGIGALVSAVPALLPHTLSLGLAVLALLTLVNLRGVRATGAAFVCPTFLFIVTLLVVMGVGLYKTIMGGGAPEPLSAVSPASAPVTTASLWVLLRAFASGCTAMTGVEAVSNGVPIFKKPAERGARRTLALIVTILMVLLAGIAFLCVTYGITATPPGEQGYQSIVSQVVAATVGRGFFYYLTIGSVVTVLALSANTSFADFPRVCRMLAADRFLPEAFMHRGRRLAFSHGIIVLSVLAGTLLVIFGGVTEGLIPLFAVGALSAFTLSQIGMIAHWRKQTPSPHVRRAFALNVVGAVATGVTLLVVVAAKFREGAWISLILVVAMLTLFYAVRRHYDFIAAATAADANLELPTQPPLAVVPMRRWDAVSLKALRFALGMTPNVTAVQVLTDDRDVDDLSERWAELTEPVPAVGIPRPSLVVLRSEYRQLFRPLVSFVLQLAEDEPERDIAVVVPELIETRWYHRLLHNQTATLMRALLLFRGGPQIVVVTTPWYLRDWVPERRRLLRLKDAFRRRPHDASSNQGFRRLKSAGESRGNR